MVLGGRRLPARYLEGEPREDRGRVPLAKLLAVSTRVGGRRHPTATRIDPPTRRQSTTPDPAQVREWATANGYSVSARGRLPRNVVDAYDAAH
ncbi:Lsr2 family DNA-binding protein [Gordonia sp. NPDC003950]